MTSPYETKAYAYHANGWSPLPLPARRKTPPPDDYTGNNGLWPSGADIAEWIQDHPDSNIGLRLPRNIIGIDVDHYGDKPGGLTLAALETKLGPLPATWTSNSRSDGISGIRFYRVPTGLRWPGILGPGIELIRYGHRYAVAAPSIHPEGGTYTWTPPNGGDCNGTIPAVDDLPDLPAAWIAHFTGGELETVDPQADLADSAAREWVQTRGTGGPCGIMTHITHKWIDRLTSGEARHDSAMKGVLAIVRMAGAGHPGGSTALGQLRSAFLASVNGDPDRDEKAEFQRMIPGAVRRVHIDHPEPVTIDPCLNPFNELISTPTPLQVASNGAATQTATITQTASFTGEIEDVDLTYQRGTLSAAVQADIVGKALRGRFLWCKALGWLRWDGRRWAACTDEELIEQIRRHQKCTVKAAIDRGTSDDDLKKIVGLLSDGNIRSVERLMRGVTGITVRNANDLDADPNLLNVANGTLDLRTRELRPHDPNDRITKVTRAAYRADTDTSVWDAFLARVIPDQAELDYLRRVFGICAYGRVREHIFPILTGTGANGKGTTYGAVVFALGDYATVVNPEMLMARERSTGHADPEMMTLRGARLAVGSEVEEGRKLDAATMKRLTGGDQLTSRHLFKDQVTWQPTHQLIYVTNKLPEVKGNDPAVWRRIRVVPFDVVLPEKEWDLELPARLELHADAVLSWIVAGYFDGLDNGGMRAPESVTRATDDYQEESDSASQFVKARCNVDRHRKATTRVLHQAYRGWAEAEGNQIMTEKAFAKELDRLGFSAKKENTGHFRQGIDLKTPEELEDAWDTTQ